MSGSFFHRFRQLRDFRVQLSGISFSFISFSQYSQDSQYSQNSQFGDSGVLLSGTALQLCRTSRTGPTSPRIRHSGVPLSGTVFYHRLFTHESYGTHRTYKPHPQNGVSGVPLSGTVFHFTFRLHSFSILLYDLKSFPSLKKIFVLVFNFQFFLLFSLSTPNARVPLYIAFLSTTYFTKHLRQTP